MASLRVENIKRHRLLGQIYVAAIVVAAITAYLIVWGDYSPFGAEVVVLASLWLITTAIAFIAARKLAILALLIPDIAFTWLNLRGPRK
jgi:hypothetical protein